MAKSRNPNPDERVRPHLPKVADLAEYRPEAVPEPPHRLRYKATRDWWVRYWGSQVATLAHTTTDIAAVSRLASLYDSREQASRSVRKNPTTTGSKGQAVENPLARAMSRYDAEIRQLEDRLGLSPRSRLALGISLGRAHRELEDLLDPPATVSDPEPDPRDVIDFPIPDNRKER